LRRALVLASKWLELLLSDFFSIDRVTLSG
jgi:hypothetical protein